MAWKWLAAGLLALWVLAGCERRAVVVQNPSDDPTTAPATEPAPPATTQTAATSPATTAPQTSTVTIDGAVNEFPGAVMRLDEADGKILALLYTDDPEAALRSDYDGNSFYFELLLDIPNAAQIGGATYDFKAISSEKVDSPDGIFLLGRRWHLQPDDIRIDFRPDPAAPAVEGVSPTSVIVRIGGTFRMFDTPSQRTTSSVVPVAGEFTARILSRQK